MDTVRQMAEMVAVADRDGDGKVGPRDFCQTMLHTTLFETGQP